MSDQIRIYHHDDPNDAPERRLAAFPTINPYLPTSLPQYVIEPVANSLYMAMQYYWYNAYQHGIAAQRQQQQQQHHQTQPTTPPQNHHHQNHQVTQQQQHNQLQQHSHQIQTNLSTTQQQVDDTEITQRLPNDHHPTPEQLREQVAAVAARQATLRTQEQQHHHHLHHHHQLHQQLHQLQRPSSSSHQSSSEREQQRPQSRRPSEDGSTTTTATIGHNNNHEHIKKPLNPFMIFMQKQRPEIVRQGDMKESAAINKHLGQLWRQLSREEQEPYYKLAEQEKLLHAQKYPGWSARDNYANQKKRKRMKLKAISLNGLDQSDKKCRARFGLQNMALWCKPCKRKKKCIYSMPSRHHSYNSNLATDGHSHSTTASTDSGYH